MTINELDVSWHRDTPKKTLRIKRYFQVGTHHSSLRCDPYWTGRNPRWNLPQRLKWGVSSVTMIMLTGKPTMVWVGNCSFPTQWDPRDPKLNNQKSICRWHQAQKQWIVVISTSGTPPRKAMINHAVLLSERSDFKWFKYQSRDYRLYCSLQRGMQPIQNRSFWLRNQDCYTCLRTSPSFCCDPACVAGSKRWIGRLSPIKFHNKRDDQLLILKKLRHNDSW